SWRATCATPARGRPHSIWKFTTTTMRAVRSARTGCRSARSTQGPSSIFAAPPTRPDRSRTSRSISTRGAIRTAIDGALSTGPAASKGHPMPKAIQRTFGAVIRERRRRLDLTQEDVARRIKTSTPYIGHLESGKRHPSEKVIARLSEVLGLQSRELFLLANPRARDLLSSTTNSGGRRSAWEEFRHDERVRCAHNISA